MDYTTKYNLKKLISNSLYLFSFLYSVELKYMQNYARLEVTAIKQKPKYIDYAIAVGILWATYRFAAAYLL